MTSWLGHGKGKKHRRHLTHRRLTRRQWRWYLGMDALFEIALSLSVGDSARVGRARSDDEWMVLARESLNKLSKKDDTFPLTG